MNDLEFKTLFASLALVASLGLKTFADDSPTPKAEALKNRVVDCEAKTSRAIEARVSETVIGKENCEGPLRSQCCSLHL
jgi:hypothetical protein